MNDKPFKMKGTPFQRNFGIGRTESPDTETPLNQIDLRTAISNIGQNISKNVAESGGWGKVAQKSLAAGMRTLKGGYDAFKPDKATEETDISEAMEDIMKEISELDPESEEYKELKNNKKYTEIFDMFENVEDLE